MSRTAATNSDHDTTIQYVEMADQGPVEYTRKGRGRLKYALTISIGKLHSTLLDPDCSAEQAKDLMTKVGDNFAAFSRYHLELHNTFTPAQKAASDMYFKEAKKEHDRVVRQTLRWIECKRANQAFDPDLEEDFEAEQEELEMPEVTPGRKDGGKESEVLQADISSRLSKIEEFLFSLAGPVGASTPQKGFEMNTALGNITELNVRPNADVRAKTTGGGKKETRPESTPVTTTAVSQAAPEGGERRTIPTGDEGRSGTDVSGASSLPDAATTALNVIAAQFSRIADNTMNRSESGTSSNSISYKLPKFKLYHFSGEAIDYYPFIKAFETQVTTHCSDPGTLLGVLMYYTPDDVQKMLRCCTLRHSPAEAYARARELLDEHFGRYEDVAQAWLTKFFSLSDVKSVKELLNLNVLLNNCQETLQSVDQIQEFETKSTLTSIVRKLPVALRNRWQSWVVDVTENCKRKIRLNDLIEFTRRIYREVSDPHYLGDIFGGKGGKPTVESTSNTEKSRGKGCYSTDVRSGPSSGNPSGTTRPMNQRDNRMLCLLCHADHPTFRCERFVGLDIESRNKVVRESGACINCFNPSHKVRDCRSKHVCRKCNKKHHTLIHYDRGTGEATSMHLNVNAPEYRPSNYARNSDYFYAAPGETQDVRYMNQQPTGQLSGMDKGLQGIYGLPSSSGSGEMASPSGNSAPTSGTYVAHTLIRGKIALPIVAVVARGPKGLVKTFAMLDTGSTSTLCSYNLIDKLGVRYDSGHTYMSTINDNRVRLECRKTSFEILDTALEFSYVLSEVTGKPTLNLSGSCRAMPCDIRRWPHLAGIPVQNAELGEIDILIGQDNSDLLVQRATIPGRGRNEPYAALSSLGWYISGPMGNPSPVQASNGEVLTCKTELQGFHADRRRGLGFGEVDEGRPWTERVEYCKQPVAGRQRGGNETPRACVGYTDESDAVLQEKVDRFFSSDDLPKDKGNQSELSYDDRKVVEMWRKRGSRNKEGKYVMPIPFKKEKLDLPNNRQLAVKRLKSLERRLLKNKDFREEYVKAIQTFIDQGFAEKVDTSNDQNKKGKIWYLPHHGVIHPRKKGVRVVHNCSATWMGYCLNDEVHQGPDLLNRLIDILLRMRQDRVLVWGDVAKMFNQILVDEDDRDVLRFLWYKDNEVGGEVVEYRMTTHLFGGIWSPSCANFVLKQVALDHGDEYPEEVCQVVDREFYVDDGMKAHSNIEKAVQTTLGVKNLLKEGTFNFTKLMSSEEQVVRQLPEADWDGGATPENLKEELKKIHHLLGTQYVPEADAFRFKTDIQEKPPTRRGVLSTTASVYDPLGLTSPVVMRAKMVFQEACKAKTGWDEELSGDLKEEWDTWLENIVNLDDVSFKRCLLPEGMSLEDEDVSFELHMFSDAAKPGYGAAAYLLTLQKGIPKGVSLIMSKGKLSPIKTQTIPRLELMGAYVSVQLSLIIKEALTLDISRTVFHVDSTIVLCYINNTDQRYPTLETNRLSFILDHTNPDQWHHVPTDQNPADLISRGCLPDELKSGLWQNGPEYLMRGEGEWPQVPPNALKKEQRANKREEEEQVICLTSLFEEEYPVGRQVYVTQLKDEPSRRLIEHYSSWWRLRRAVVYFHKFILWLKYRKFTMSDVTVQTMDDVAHSILKYEQRRIREDCSTNQKKQYAKLYPLEREGLLRVGGRLSKSDLHPDMKQPIIVPAGHLARLLIREAHQVTVHGGSLRTLEQVQQRYWVLRARRQVRGVIHECIPCQRKKSPLLTPIMKDLPRERVTGEVPPFTYTGVDYFGPLIVKRGRCDHKRYGCIFTCFQTRAVHIELAWSLDLESCMAAVFRFAARRRMPRKMWSDNGTNFVSTDKTCKKAIQEWNKVQLSNEMMQKGCDWRFNVPGASHQGGVWERQIRTVREILLSLINCQKLTDESLLTFLAMTEDVMNNRPITPVRIDALDLAALTPNSLLKPGVPAMLPPGIFEERDVYRRKWMQIQYLTDVFWRRWKGEYLPTLQVRSKWYETARSLKVGDLVILQEEGTPRNFWPMARVIEIYPDEKGVVRSVKIRTTRGEYKRPVHKLCLLEGSAT